MWPDCFSETNLHKLLIIMKAIVNADDFGKSHTINDAIVYAFKNKIINQTTLMVTEIYCDEAVALAKENGFINHVGLHLNLDEGKPLTENIRNLELFCDKDGLFNKRFDKRMFTRLCFVDAKVRNFCSEEIDAQIQSYLKTGSSLMHIDSHHYVHFNGSILSLLIPIAKSYGIKSMRISHINSTDSILRTWYKRMNNRKIQKYFSTTEIFFGGYSNFLNQKKVNYESFEIMIHPDYIEDTYVDVIDKRCHKFGNLDQVTVLSTNI